MSDYSQRRDAEKAQRARQLRQDYQEVQALYQAKLAQGMTPAQAATSQGNIPAGSYTVKTGDNINTISQNTGVNPQDILSANPDVSQIQTGMILQTPTLPTGQPNNPVTSASGALNPQAAQGSETWRIQQQNNGTMAYKPPIPVTSQRPLRPGQAQQNAGTPPQGYYNANASYGGSYNPSGNAPGIPPKPYKPYPLYPQPAANSPAQNTPLNQGGFVNGVNPYSQFGLNTGYEKSLVLERFMQQTMAQGYIPSNEVTRYLELNGYIRPAQNATAPSQFSASGNYRIKRGGGGGGGGGGGNSTTRPAAYDNNNAPAFSGGAGFGGLVNWRI